MLVIKEERIQDLEKFGFKHDSFGFWHFVLELPRGEQRLSVDDDTREIWTSHTADSVLTILFDLIEEGMVEKEEE